MPSDRCDNCGSPDASLAWEGYSTPYPDVAPSYSQWEELYLCDDCKAEREELARKRACIRDEYRRGTV